VFIQNAQFYRAECQGNFFIEAWLNQVAEAYARILAWSSSVLPSSDWNRWYAFKAVRKVSSTPRTFAPNSRNRFL
jgi:hypothetical protein